MKTGTLFGTPALLVEEHDLVVTLKLLDDSVGRRYVHSTAYEMQTDEHRVVEGHTVSWGTSLANIFEPGTLDAPVMTI